MKFTLTFLFTSLTLLASISQNTLSNIYKDGVKNGMYKSYYPNGELRVEGKYVNNLRKGSWILYDSLGTKVMVREYGKNKDLTVTIFSGDDQKVINEEPKSKNEDGYFDFPKIIPNDVLFSKRLWKELEPSKLNKPLFKVNKLYEELLNSIEKDEITGYSPDSDEFKTALDSSALNSLRGRHVVKYKLKEDWYYDNASQRGGSFVIGFCPVILIDGKEKDAFWIYYPEVRKQLAELKLDDMFFFHQFNSTIVKESNIKNKRLDQYLLPAEILNEILRIEWLLIETEVHFWLKQTES